MQIAGMLTMERGIEAAKVGSQDAVRLVGKRQHRKGIRIDERRERVHARKFLRIDWFHVIFGQRPAFGESPSQNLNSRYSEMFEKVEYHKALGGGGIWVIYLAASPMEPFRRCDCAAPGITSENILWNF